MAGAIEEARRRQRRRRLRLLAALAVGTAAAAATAGALRGQQQRVQAIRSPRPGLQIPVLAPASVLSRAPYMGVACPQPNAIACDRVGLAIWLKRPAVSVSAKIAGQPLKLDWAGDRRPRFASHDPRSEFDGFLQPAGLTTRLHVRPTEPARSDPLCGCMTGPVWYGENTPSPIVELEIRYPHGTRVLTRLRVGLAAGWG